MSNKKLLIVAAASLIIITLAGVYLLSSGAKADAQTNDQVYDQLYVCSMHPWIAADKPDKCALCGMALSKVENHRPGTPLPAEDRLFVSSKKPAYIQEGGGKDPFGDEDLIPIAQSPFYEPRTDQKAEAAPETKEQTKTGQLWTCGMHPQVISDKPGLCPICHMKLIPLKSSAADASGVVQIDQTTLQNIGVTLEQAARRDLSYSIRANGIVQMAEDKQYAVNSRVEGYVEKLYAKKTGEWVQAGQPLLEIYSPDLLSAQQEFLTALSMNTGDKLIAAARQRLQLWGIDDAQIKELERSKQVNRTMTLTAPADGIIMDKMVVEGSAVMMGENLFMLANLRTVWVKAQIYEYELPWVKTGDKVKITSVNNPHWSETGTVDFIYPMLDMDNRTADVRIVLNNRNLALKPEMYVEAEILSQPVEGAVSVSKQSVIRSGTRDVVFVFLGEGKFQPRLVHLGLETDDYYEILHNLQPGETIASSAAFLLESEGKLQEAVARRLSMSKGGEVEVEAAKKAAGAHSGH